MSYVKPMVIINNDCKTFELSWYSYNDETQKWDIMFNDGYKKYSYGPDRVKVLECSKEPDPHMYRISRSGRVLTNIICIFEFKHADTYWRIRFRNGDEREYRLTDLEVEKSCLNNVHSKRVFQYLKNIAGLSDVKKAITGEVILKERYENLSFISEDSVLASYLNPRKTKLCFKEFSDTLIFPFGCNNSQYNAVKAAMENNLSVIQGPPGTGKTQTILNIIANIIMQGKMFR